MTSARPMQGVTVVELGHNVAAPYGGQIMADLGARVVKVESPGGDAARGWPPFDDAGRSAVFRALNRGKLAVTVDMKDDASRADLLAFIHAEADVVIQNLRPGVVEKFGLDGDALTSEKSALIYCNLGAFGAIGPMKDKPGYDPLMQAFGGLMSLQGEGPGRPPVRAGTSLNDMGSGMWMTIAILAALYERRSTGKGGLIDLSLFETAVSWMTIPIASYLTSGEMDPPAGSGAAFIAPYQAFRSADSYIMIAAASDGLFDKLADVLGRGEWSTDPRFSTNAERVRNRVELIDQISEIIAGATTDVWRERLDAAGVPNAPLQTIEEVVAHPQTEALDILQIAMDGSGERLVGLPMSFDGERPPMMLRPPHLGEHDALIRRPETTRED